MSSDENLNFLVRMQTSHPIKWCSLILVTALAVSVIGRPVIFMNDVSNSMKTFSYFTIL